MTFSTTGLRKWVSKRMPLYKGIFWYIGEQLFCIKAVCDNVGCIVDNVELSSKSGTNFNHKVEWTKLPKQITQRKPFDYYPRGRVELVRAQKLTARIYLNPTLCEEGIKEQIRLSFGLNEENGITKINFIADGSAHYWASQTNILQTTISGGKFPPIMRWRSC